MGVVGAAAAIAAKVLASLALGVVRQGELRLGGVGLDKTADN